MIYGVIVSHVDFPEELYKRVPGVLARSPDTFVTAAVLQRVGREKIRYIQLGEFTASIVHESGFFALIVHDGDEEGAKNIGEMLKKYFKQLAIEGRMPEEEELNEIIAYAILPSYKEVQELVSEIEIDREPFFNIGTVYERFSLFEQMSASFRRAIEKIKEEELYKAFLDGEFYKVLKYLEDKNDLSRAIIVKSAVHLYLSAPALPVPSPRYVMKIVKEIYDERIRAYLRTLVEFATGKKTYGDLALVANEYLDYFLEKIQDNPIYAAVFAFPQNTSKLYEVGVEALRGKSAYFEALYQSLLDLGASLEAAQRGDRDALIEIQKKTRERVKETIKTGNYNVLAFRLYGYFRSEYLIFASAAKEYKENLSSLLRSAAMLLSAVLPISEDFENTAPSYARVYPMIASLRATTFSILFHHLTDPEMFNSLVPIYSEGIKSVLKNLKRRIAAGRASSDTIIQALSEVGVFISLLASYIKGFEGLVPPIAKSAFDLLKISDTRGLYLDSRMNQVSRYNRSELVASLLGIIIMTFGKLHTNVRAFLKAVQLIERIILFVALDDKHIDRLTGAIPLLVYLEYVMRNKIFMSSETFKLKFESVIKLVKEYKVTPIPKYILYYELYNLAKELGSMSDTLLDIYSSRLEYRKSVEGDIEMVEKMKRAFFRFIMLVIVTPLGLAYKEGKEVKFILFEPLEPEAVAKKLIDIEQGKLIEEYEKLPKGEIKSVPYLVDIGLAKESIEASREMYEIVEAVERKGEEIFGEKYKEYLRRLSIEVLKRKLSKELTRKDVIVVQLVKLLDSLEKIANQLANQLREMYGAHFPALSPKTEVGDKIDNEKYMRIIAEIGPATNMTVEKLRPILGEKLAKEVVEAARIGPIILFDEATIELLREIAAIGVNIYKAIEKTKKRISEIVQEIAPNTSYLVGDVIAARLIYMAKGLERLAKMPGSKIQVLGAEKALFRSLHKGTPPPKHGIIFRHPMVNRTPKAVRGKIARSLAAKLAIAARVDAYSGKFIADQLKAELEERHKRILEEYREALESGLLKRKKAMKKEKKAKPSKRPSRGKKPKKRRRKRV